MFLQRDLIEEAIREIQVKMDQAGVERITELPVEQQEQLVQNLRNVIQKSQSQSSHIA